MRRKKPSNDDLILEKLSDIETVLKALLLQLQVNAWNQPPQYVPLYPYQPWTPREPPFYYQPTITSGGTLT